MPHPTYLTLKTGGHTALSVSLSITNAGAFRSNPSVHQVHPRGPGSVFCSGAEQGGRKLRSINATQGIQSSASDVSAEPLLMACTPAPAWVEKPPLVSQHPDCPSLPSLQKPHALSLAMLRFPCWASSNTHGMVPAVPSLYPCALWHSHRRGKGSGLAQGMCSQHCSQVGHPCNDSTLPLQQLHPVEQKPSNKWAAWTQAEGSPWLDHITK